MSNIISFFLPGVPVPKARPRVAKGRAYTPEATKRYAQAIGYACGIEMARNGWQQVQGPVWLNLVFSLPIPSSLPKRDRIAALNGEYAPAVRPDIDNYAKNVLDGLNGLAYKDDGQVVRMAATKVYSDEPGVLIQVGPWAYVEAVKAGVAT